ncbi:MAG: SdrD B-like domain-containing protein [Caldilineaceae bacterium]
MELLLDPAPIEIGNRIWEDTDNDGVQDPDEAGINGVQVTLYNMDNGGTQVGATQTTSGNGDFLHKPECQHQLPGGVSLSDAEITSRSLFITTSNADGQGTDNNNKTDLHDSDGDNGVLNAGFSTIAFTTGGPGENNHTLDFGFSSVEPQLPATLKIIKQVSGGSVSDPFTVTITGPNNYSSSVSVTSGTPTVISDLDPGMYTVIEELPIATVAPMGLAWLDTDYEPVGGTITIGNGETGTITVTNYLGEESVAPTGVLTVTKTVDWNGNTPNPSQQFAYTIEGPDGFTTINDTITDTGVMTYAVPLGVYTVTESSPGAGWVTTYTVNSVANGVSGIVALTGGSNSVAPFGPTTVSGTIYRDFNANGQFDTTGETVEVALQGVTATVYDSDGNVVGTALSDVNGVYTVNPTGQGPYQVIFSALPAGYEPSTQGAGNGTSVQFVNSVGEATNVDFAVNQPCDYCQSSPDLFIPLYTNGDSQHATPGVAASNPALVRVDYDSYATSSDPDAPAAPTTMVAGRDLGATWGAAYHRSAGKLFLSAVQRRHVGFGPQGPGGIYLVDVATNSVTDWLDVNALIGFDVGSDPHTGLPNGGGGAAGASRDLASFDAVGKLAFGDIDLSPDERTLWAVDLNNRQLLELPLDPQLNAPAAGAIVAHPIPDPTPACNNGTLRPWALAVADGMVYVGAVCSGESGGTAADLRAIIYRHDPEGADGNFTELFSFNLNTIDKGCTIDVPPGTGHQCNGFQPWTNAWSTFTVSNNFAAYPQPILSDLIFDDDGSLILGFMDRTGMQTGYQNYRPDTTATTLYTGATGGDLVRACNVNGVLKLEGTDAACPQHTGSASESEFYYREGMPRVGTPTDLHDEAAQGALALRRGSGEVVTTLTDPTEAQSGGLGWFDNATGNLSTAAASGQTRVYRVFDGDSTTAQFYVGKSAGLGDLELLCDPAPIAIGNRVWEDLDGDGQQDAGEPGISNLTVMLVGADGTNTSTTTDSTGNYYFGALTAYTAYTLTISVPGGYGLTIPDAVALAGAGVSSNHAISDTIDSDALLVNGTPTIRYTTGGPGQNNHSLDFGFVQSASGQVDILNTAPEPLPAPAALRIVKEVSGGSVSAPFTVTVTGPNSYNTTVTVVPGTPTDLTNLEAGQYTVVEETPPTSSAPAGHQWTGIGYAPTNGEITLSSGMIGTITVTNILAEAPVAHRRSHGDQDRRLERQYT